MVTMKGCREFNNLGGVISEEIWDLCGFIRYFGNVCFLWLFPGKEQPSGS